MLWLMRVSKRPVENRVCLQVDENAYELHNAKMRFLEYCNGFMSREIFTNSSFVAYYDPFSFLKQMYFHVKAM